ncbi:MAG: polysaccharide deacetylase family protein [Dehalococcoidia bacterium]|nr:polysaccharide deacetylase family protein [Dehalococcoidia bacterium]
MSKSSDAAPPSLRWLYKTMLGSYYYSGVARAHLWATKGARNCVVLLYHGVSQCPGPRPSLSGNMFVPAEEFERQMRFLKEHFALMPLRIAVAHLEKGIPFPARSAVVTFDDGYQNIADHAFPVLQRFDIPFTFFVTTDFMDGRSGAWWDHLEAIVNRPTHGEFSLSLATKTETYDLGTIRDKRYLYRRGQSIVLTCPSQQGPLLDYLERELGSPHAMDRDTSFMTWDVLKSLATSPLVEIGAHSVSHPNLARIPMGSAKREISGSKDVLEAALGQPVTSFAYPFGQQWTFSDETCALLKESGFRCAVTGIEGKVSADVDPFRLYRVPVSGDDSWPIFISKVAGGSAALRSAWRRSQVSRRPNGKSIP